MAEFKKIPAKATSRKDDKHVKITQNQSYKSEKPAWRFSCIDIDGPFAWPKQTKIELDIVQKLHSFDSMTWQEIEGPDHHSIDISKLSKEAKSRLTQLQKDDLDTVFSFHLGGRPRIYCVRINGIAQLLWYDPEHKVCPSIKKHT